MIVFVFIFYAIHPFKSFFELILNQNFYSSKVKKNRLVTKNIKKNHLNFFQLLSKDYTYGFSNPLIEKKSIYTLI